MTIDLESPAKIYSNVSHEVNAILQQLDGASGDEKVANAKEASRAILEEFRVGIDKQISDLEKHAEWDTFTIAFYGETNAGKSTIIETLRIMLAEQGKVEMQQKFKALQAEHDVTEANFEALRQSVADAEKLIGEVDTRLGDLVRHYDEQEAMLKSKIAGLQHRIDEKKASLWQKLAGLFRKLPEEKECKALKADLSAVETERQGCVEPEQRKLLQAEQQKAGAVREYERLESGLKQLEAFADGNIIGNGRSDYTVETQRYEFEAGGQKFALLDVPGIEGKETKVMDNIQSAVQKAHAVFYVTGKPTAPQKGEENHRGTLEKIKDHLGAQTEVWTIFNKRITNPVQLDKPELVGEDETASLRDLDKRMREQLGGNYQQVISLSAQPAFLAVADCLPPGSPNAKNRTKFLGKFNSLELLSKSRLQHFHDMLTGKLAGDHKTKIKRSNFNKAGSVVKDAAHKINRIHETTFKELAEQLKDEALGAQQQLDLSFEALKSRLEAQGERATEQFSSEVRKRIYRRIENDLDNDDFKHALESCIRSEQANLEQRLPELMEAETARFHEEITEVIERFREHASDLMDAYRNMRIGQVDSGFDLNIKIDNGIKVTSLLGTLAGAALMIWNPAGWAVAVIGGLTLLVSLGKALRSFFSSDYKKSQQRQSADENLDTLSRKMRRSLRESLSTAIPELESKIGGLKDALNEPAHQAARISATLVESVAKLTRLSNSIDSAIGTR